MVEEIRASAFRPPEKPAHEREGVRALRANQLRDRTEITDVGTILERDLPTPISSLIDEYDDVIGFRDRFLFKWLHTVMPHFTLPSVPNDRLERVRGDKSVATLFITLLDDFGERDGYEETFSALKCLPEGKSPSIVEVPNDESEYVSFTRRVWERLLDRLADAPRFDEFKDVLLFDFRQAINAIEYSGLVNDNLSMMNPTESMVYCPQNMLLYPLVDIDLMYSPEFDSGEFGVLREVVGEAQKLARIGNWVTTWERELDERDFSAGVYSYAVDEGIVSPHELQRLRESDDRSLREEVHERLHDSGIERRLLDEWGERYAALRNRDHGIESVDIDAFVAGMRTVLSYHLASRGYK